MSRRRVADRQISPATVGLLGLGILMFASAGCWPSEDPQGLEIFLRFIDREPQTLFQPGRLLDHEDNLVASGTKMSLDDDVRNVLMALPGLPVERRLDVPRGARFRFSYGAPPNAPLALHFSVSADPEDAEPIVLFSASLETESDLDRWHEAEIDLSSLGGRRVRLELTARSDQPVDLQQGIPIWGNPEVWAPSRDEPPPNVVLISIDTLRSDRMSIYGHTRPTTPNLEAWAQSSATVFSHAVAQAPWTLPSHLSMLTGLNAHRQADLLPYSRDSQRLVHLEQAQFAQASLYLMAERLRERGFSTLAVTGGGLMHPRLGFSQGFDRFRYFGGDRVESGDELQVGMETALSWLEENRERPFFLFFHTYEVHGPFLVREPYFSRFSTTPIEGDRIRNATKIQYGASEGFLWTRPFSVETPPGVDGEELFKAVYDSGIAYTDMHLQRLLRALAEMGLDRRTIVVVTSDHGHLIGEHGLIGHHYLYDENLLVPLIISDPEGRGAGRRVSRQVRLIDVLPTVLELAGLPPPEDVDGVSLVPLMDARELGEPAEAWSYATRPNRGVSVRIGNDLKYVFNNTVWGPLRGQETLFRLDGAGETEIPISQVPEIESLRERVLRALDQQAPGLRMRFETDESSSFSGRIRGSLISQNSVKSSDMACACLTWLAEGEAAFEVPPGRTFTVNFEQAWGREFVLEVTAVRGGETVAFKQTLDPGAIEGRHWVALTSSGWRSGPGSIPGSRAGISFWWVGERRQAAPREVVPDPALKARLEALGYLD